MSKRFFVNVALAVASAFALTVAAPAWACGGDCDCAKKGATEKKPATKPDEKQEKKDAKTTGVVAPAAVKLAADAPPPCQCEKGGKNCTCPKGQCKCANCGQAPTKLSAADEKPAQPACECGKGKPCTCKKEECKCPACHGGKRA